MARDDPRCGPSQVLRRADADEAAQRAREGEARRKEAEAAYEEPEVPEKSEEEKKGGASRFYKIYSLRWFLSVFDPWLPACWAAPAAVKRGRRAPA